MLTELIPGQIYVNNYVFVCTDVEKYKCTKQTNLDTHMKPVFSFQS